MKKISQKDIDYILDNTDIVDLVSEYVNLEKRGQNYKGLCPFHNEKTPSFTVSPDKKIAHCFGCGNGGNIFQFLSKIENITYNQAIVKLGKKLGLDLDYHSDKKEIYDLNNEIDLIYYSNELIADYYNYILLNTKEAEKALKYLLDRGLTKETIKFFKLGYSPDNSTVIDFFNTKNISMDIIKRAGIIGESNGTYYDIFKNRIMFPIKDKQNRVVAFSGRIMSSDKGIAKYYNTHETEIFEKRNVIYNLSDARQDILREKQIIICEGYMDVIKSYQFGVKNIVALMGTNLDNSNIKEILKLTDNIVLALDNDSAGIDSALEIGNNFINNTNKIYKLSFNNAKDIDEFISNKYSNSENFNFKEYVSNNKKHFINFKIDYLLEKSLNDIENKINYKNELLSDIGSILDKSLQDILLTELSSKFNIDKYTLSKELLNYINKNNFNVISNIHKDNISFNQIYSNKIYDKKICTLFKYFFKDRKIFLEYYEELDGYIFKDDVFSRLFDATIIYYNNYNIFEANKFINNIKDFELINLVNYIVSDDTLIVDENNSIYIVKDYITYLKYNFNSINDISIIKDNLKKAIFESSYEKQLEILEKLTKYKK